MNADNPENSTGSIRPPCRREDAETVLRRLRDAGHVAYFAGGCVRDLLLGREPKDWDVATDARPEVVRKLFPRTQAVGAKFGVILVRQGESVVEVATFRTDVSYEDGRHPTQVKFTTAEEDAKRRDFTVNGLFLDPLDGDRVIDYVAGQEDLKNKILRAIGEPSHRFEEDHLRMLRAVRFAARFGLKIDPATFQAIRQHATQLKRISPERIAGELRLMLAPPTRTTAWELLWLAELVSVIFRELPTDFSNARQSIELFALVDPGQPISFGLALASAMISCLWRTRERQTLERELSTAIAHAHRWIRQLLRVSNEESDAMHQILRGAASAIFDLESVAQRRRFLMRSTERETITLARAVAVVGAFEQQVDDLVRDLAPLRTRELAPPPLLTGDALTAAGFKPGPAFKRVLDRVYDAQLDDRVKTTDEALQLARDLMPKA